MNQIVRSTALEETKREFERVRTMEETEFDFEFTPVKRGFDPTLDKRDFDQPRNLIVASEDEWRTLSGWKIMGDTEAGPSAKIRINAEVLFSGDDGPNSKMGWRNIMQAVEHPTDLTLSDIITRVLKTTEGSQATFYWWLGDSFVDGNHFAGIVGAWEVFCKGIAKNWHIGTTKANESELESIKDFVKGTWVQGTTE